ncbi:MAG: Lon protease family protein [Syntrophomonadaceae bacterium]
MNINQYRLKVRQLRKNCSPSLFSFNSTADLKPLRGIIGQGRAVRALSLGLEVPNQGYNIYLAGPFGTGKSSLAKEMLEEQAATKAIPHDWCYVHNFKEADTPVAIQLPPGQGQEFKKDITSGVEALIKNIVKALEGEDFETQKNIILNKFLEETNQMYLDLDEEARRHGFSISRTQSGINTTPIKEDGEALTQEEYTVMTEAQRVEIMRTGALIQERINEAIRKYKEAEKGIREKIKKLEEETAQTVTLPLFDQLFEKYQDNETIIAYLKDMQKDLIENTESFVKTEESVPLMFFRHMDRRSSLRKYQVNLLVDNSALAHAPVIVETNPTYANLFGQIEYEGEFGILATDFSKIKPGAIHKANGGYLILHVNDLLKNYFVWDSLKKVLKNREIKVENIGRVMGFTNTETLQPQPIPMDIKLVLIGDSWYYHALYAFDDEFRKLFKIRADFDVEMDKTRGNMKQYAQLIAGVCQRENLLHFTPDGVASVVDYSTRMAEDQEKLTTLFNKLVEVVYEAHHWARQDKAELVSAQHVRKAIKEKQERCSMVEERIQELINRNTLIINVDEYKVGEINGLAVYQVGEYHFGKPVRITAKTFMGEKGLVNIEREIRLSGQIHSKGVLTLSGYMGAQYAQDKPLTLSASLTFEQSYQGVEGDSASSAELYALLSSLANVPIYQGIAVTGSVNQNGEIQPVGGVNQKIEGFFKTCQDKGLNGRQGVIIPQQNITQLMLDDNVVEAVRQRRFNIWAVEHIDQGLEILTGMPAGSRDERGYFTPDSVHFRVNQKLQQWTERRRSMNIAAPPIPRKKRRIRRRVR